MAPDENGEPPEEWYERWSERRLWVGMTIGLHGLLSTLALQPVADRGDLLDRIWPAFILTGVVVYPLSWVLWVAAHPDPPPPGYSPKRVRGLVRLVSLVLAFGLGLLVLALSRK